MRTERVFHSNLWLGVSLALLLSLVMACCASKQNGEVKQERVKEMPKPGTENPQQVDSLKNSIDQQRRNKKKNQ